ncbi:hypothetical protein DUNSADRAFT_16151 [Dunaliella salina]|uniref:Encoded protein n=1 Tax=Dunaliella salina TaxID=3046 RepID=A0ABQ7G491_DUNSA|nr:hypothetical protein DUNSADRAFT_16151 [Dunaliella salina]|eukprot:KAF5829397.1 hypothetical protein DUNSADRAFT_16151 [Dunaliella salina]
MPRDRALREVPPPHAQALRSGAHFYRGKSNWLREETTFNPWIQPSSSARDKRGRRGLHASIALCKEHAILGEEFGQKYMPVRMHPQRTISSSHFMHSTANMNPEPSLSRRMVMHVNVSQSWKIRRESGVVLCFPHPAFHEEYMRLFRRRDESAHLTSHQRQTVESHALGKGSMLAHQHRGVRVVHEEYLPTQAAFATCRAFVVWCWYPHLPRSEGVLARAGP